MLEIPKTMSFEIDKNIVKVTEDNLQLTTKKLWLSRVLERDSERRREKMMKKKQVKNKGWAS